MNHVRTMLTTMALAAVVGLMPATMAHAQDQMSPEMQAALRLVEEGQFDEAVDAFTTLTKSEPTNGQAWFMRAYALHAAGRLDEAMEAHQRAAQFPRYRAIATYNLGCAYALKGRTDDAFAALETACEVGGLDPDQWANDTDLVSLHDDPRWKPLMARVDEVDDHPPAIALRFWVGEWDVYNRQGKQAGTNSITLRDNRRVVYEKWTSASGAGGGESFNYFDPVDLKWHQIWVDGSGNVLAMTGTFHDGAMRFEGEERYRSGRTAMHRTTLTPLDGGMVRQYIENSKDGGATWEVAYDFLYLPQGQEFNGWPSAIAAETADD